MNEIELHSSLRLSELSNHLKRVSSCSLESFLCFHLEGHPIIFLSFSSSLNLILLWEFFFGGVCSASFVFVVSEAVMCLFTSKLIPREKERALRDHLKLLFDLNDERFRFEFQIKPQKISNDDITLHVSSHQ